MTEFGPETERAIRELGIERRRETNRIYRAIMLSPTIEICEALLRREKVPIDVLDQEWVKRFGLRR